MVASRLSGRRLPMVDQVEIAVIHEAVNAWDAVRRAVHIGDERAVRIFGSGDFSEVVQSAAFSRQCDGVGDADHGGSARSDGIDDETGGGAIDLRDPVG